MEVTPAMPPAPIIQNSWNSIIAETVDASPLTATQILSLSKVEQLLRNLRNDPPSAANYVSSSDINEDDS